MRQVRVCACMCGVCGGGRWGVWERGGALLTQTQLDQDPASPYSHDICLCVHVRMCACVHMYANVPLCAYVRECAGVCAGIAVRWDGRGPLHTQAPAACNEGGWECVPHAAGYARAGYLYARQPATAHLRLRLYAPLSTVHRHAPTRTHTHTHTIYPPPPTTTLTAPRTTTAPAPCTRACGRPWHGCTAARAAPTAAWRHCWRPGGSCLQS